MKCCDLCGKELKTLDETFEVIAESNERHDVTKTVCLKCFEEICRLEKAKL
jgi:hypothetical protein